MQRAVKRAGIDDFGRWPRSPGPPRETRLRADDPGGDRHRPNPTQHGFDFETEDAPAFDNKVTLPGPVDSVGWPRTGHHHRPDPVAELPSRRWTTPLKDTQYELKVPAGKADIVAARLSDAPAAELASLKYYTVKPGETLLAIARKLRVSKADLAEANYLKVTARVAPGQKLMVPHEASVLMAARTDRPAPATEARTTVAESSELTEGGTTSGRVRTNYQVKSGDTLASVARLFQTTVASIKSWNPRLPGSRLLAGQKLTVYRIAN